MEKKALNIVKDYIMEHLDKSDDIYEEYIEVYTVWKCKALQNWKFLISSTILDESGKFRTVVMKNVNEIMDSLTHKGIISGWKVGDYI